MTYGAAWPPEIDATSAPTLTVVIALAIAAINR